MKLRLVDTASEFLDRASTFLETDEPRHNLILGLATTIREQDERDPELRFWVVEERGRVEAAAIRTPPWPLVLARPATDSALELLVTGIEDDLPGVTGATPEVSRFADLWTVRTGAVARIRMNQGVYALERLSQLLPPPSGAPRRASAADRERLVDWYGAFLLEAMGSDSPDLEDLAGNVDRRLEQPGSGLVFWEDGEPVSLVGYGGRTRHGIRVGPVYTPPAHRGHRYASALVAAVSAERLAEGRRFCFLYTDLANPTSNAIYERIGYELVCESAEIAFEPAVS